MDPKTTIEKLQILLPHWIEHNRNHGVEFRKWAASARSEGSESLAKLLDRVAETMVATEELLKKTEMEIGGSGEDHPHSHPHSHSHSHLTLPHDHGPGTDSSRSSHAN